MSRSFARRLRRRIWRMRRVQRAFTCSFGGSPHREPSFGSNDHDRDDWYVIVDCVLDAAWEDLVAHPGAGVRLPERLRSPLQLADPITRLGRRERVPARARDA